MLGNIKWLLIIGMLGGPVLSYLSYQDGKRFELLKNDGVTVNAYIEGAVEKSGRRGSKSYEVDLSWQDANGETRRADGVSITNAFAGDIIQNNAIVAETLEVLYLPGDASIEPAVAGDLTAQIRRAGSMVKVGGGAGIIGLIGTILFFVVGRRRKQPG